MHEKTGVTQTELAALTGLQPSTVFRIFAVLEKKGMIRNGGPGTAAEDRRGRRPLRYSLNPEAACSIGVDLSTYGAAVLLFDFTGAAAARESLRFPPGIRAEAAVEKTLRVIGKVLESAGVRRESLLGIGVGVPGVVDIEDGRVVKYARFPGMAGYPLREIIEKRFGVPVHVHNNTSLIAFAECRYGPAGGAHSILAFLLRAGVGAAYINDGRIYVSQGKTAFEAGHILSGLAASAETALEDLLSENAVLRRVKAAVPELRGWPDLLRGIKKKDPRIAGALSGAAEVLARAVRNIGVLLNPESVLIITRFAGLSAYFSAAVAVHLEAASRDNLLDIRRIIPLAYDPEKAARGAADLVFDGYFAGN
jgi:predicted NBD/HSP70 family sugar kinase